VNPVGIVLRLGLMLVMVSAPAPGGRVSGTGSGVLLLPPFSGDRVTIVIEPSGRFDVTHVDKLGREFDRLAGMITCVEVRDTTAFMTGTIDRGRGPELAGDLRGKILPITIADHGSSDLAGLAPPSEMTPPCAPVPMSMVIDDGNFTVR
jgi:hypothetical protein